VTCCGGLGSPPNSERVDLPPGGCLTLVDDLVHAKSTDVKHDIFRETIKNLCKPFFSFFAGL